MSKLSSACYALRNIRPLLSQATLKTIYYASIHSLISYGIICWGNSAHAKKVFIIQKKSIHIITNSKITDSCRQHFIKLQIMTLYSQYIYSLKVHTITHIYTYIIVKFIVMKQDKKITCTFQ